MFTHTYHSVFFDSERRSSRRSAKNRTSSKASLAINRSNNPQDQQIENVSGTRTKDASIFMNRSANYSSNVFIEQKLFIRPNRRFPGILRTPKREFKFEKECTLNGVERIFSTSSTSGKIYLAKVSSYDHDPSKPIKETTLQPLEYPSMNNFLPKKGYRSIMVLHVHEIKKLARLGGKMTVNGFNPLSKSNPSIWPYPCSRPFFKTCWLYRTLNARTLPTLALQLKIIWCCLRWDDMLAKPPTNNGKIVTNTDTGIVSTEILRHRIGGRFSEQTDYLRLTLLIPYGYADPQPNKGKHRYHFFTHSKEAAQNK